MPARPTRALLLLSARVTSISVSVHFVMSTAGMWWTPPVSRRLLSSDRSVTPFIEFESSGLVSPNPRPLITSWYVSLRPTLKKGWLTANSCGSLARGAQIAAAENCEPPPSKAATVRVGATSDGMYSPGHAWNWAAIVWYAGLQFRLGLEGWPGSLPTNR